jgi:glycosyltransferase involved in cell wall biosynthesis
MLAPVYESVPPPLYGGTERVVAVLTEELVRRGHDVTLFASGDSKTAARLVPTVDEAIWRNSKYEDGIPFMLMAVDRVYQNAGEFDIIHNHVEALAYPLARVVHQTPTITTLHGRLDLPELEPLYRYFPDMPLVAISNSQREPLAWANWVDTIYNGIALDEFDLQPCPGDYLAFLGRISPEKGLDIAIAVARRAGMPLKIAARLPLNQPYNAEAQRDWRYYREVIEPMLEEPDVELLGEVTGTDKSKLLEGAAALLFPIKWPEPFGLVMAESLACGTPVVALRRGSVPEVIEDGVTGFVVDDEDAMVKAVQRLPEIDRVRCREVAERRFSPEAMTDNYERVFRQLIGLPAATAA